MSDNANPNFEKPNFEKTAFSTNVDNSIDQSEKPTPFELSVQKLFIWYDGEREKGLRVSTEYRDLFACLTPRQIKSFLRERLLAAHEPEGRDPLLSLLSTLFHPIWKVWRDERTLFESLAIMARAAIRLSPTADGKDRDAGKLSGPAADFFHQQLLAATRKSSVLTEDDVRACWPRKSEERSLLVHLLTLIANPPLPPNPITTLSYGGIPAAATITSSVTPASAPPPFADWVYRQLGTKPVGLSVAEQVSSFQDKVLAKRRNGDPSALLTVKLYADIYLDEHMKSLDASTAPSLSNLAVMINDVAEAETQCERLFEAAVKLARPGSRYPFYYVEFLLDVLADPSRRERLRPNDKTGDTIIAKAKDILEEVKSDDLESKDRFYRAVLLARLDAKNTEDKTKRMATIWSLAKQYAATLLNDGREPSSRLNDLLDAVIGKGGANFQLKEPLQGIIWAAQVKSGNAGWPMAIQIANDLVGQSGSSTPEEMIGIRMNAALVVDVDLLAAGESDRLAAIWSQTGALLAQRHRKAAQSRTALAFVASLAYGGGAQSFDRMRTTFDLLGMGDGRLSPATWRELLGHYTPLADQIEQGVLNASVMTEVRDAVFGTDFEPIHTPDALADAMKWKDMAFEWAGGKGFDDAVAELMFGGKQ
jgi:hypothetical protein